MTIHLHTLIVVLVALLIVAVAIHVLRSLTR